MEIIDQIKAVRNVVEAYLDKSSEFEYQYSEDERDHIINIGTSILCTKWGIGYEGGSFVQAVVDNKLMEAVGRADSINVKMLPFYCKLIYNAIYPL
jgi:hypothetical protein